MNRHAVITGASSGIGAATARRLAVDGWTVTIGARRAERLESLSKDIGAKALPLDVTSTDSVDAFAAEVDECSLLVCCAGGALGLDPIEDADEADWAAMWESNVMGTFRVVKRLLPTLLASGDGQVTLIGSIAGFDPYPGGGGYNAAKHAVRALRDVLRLELLGRPIRVTEIVPGMVAETEFALVRFRGDGERAAAVYEGVTPLTADDVADCVAWVGSRPSRVNIDRMVVKPRDQADARTIHRASASDGEAGASSI
jgi:hypothetical protein